MTAITIVSAGALTLVQDQGRPDGPSLGVAVSGAADRAAAALANRLVGNPPQAPVLESLLGGLRAVCDGDITIAVTGAEAPVTVGGQEQARCRAVRVPRGAEVSIGTATRGLRTYTAIRSGLVVPPVLGSRSTDTMAQLGPDALSGGDVLTVGAATPAGEAWFETVAVPRIPDEVRVRITLGPHDDVLSAEAWRALEATRWTVAPDSSRAGIRLDGPALPAPTGDLLSFPVVPGAVQLLPRGTVIVLGPDAGITGGYPVLGVVGAAGQDALAQARPGTILRIHHEPVRSGR